MVSRRNSTDSPREDGFEPPAPTPGSTGRSRGGKDKEVFPCDHPGCGQSYSRLEYLRRHQRKHQDDRPFQCKDCTKAFARSDVLLRHRRRCHPTPPPADRDIGSPPNAQRGSYGVPISDAREMSPSLGRKHPRQPSGTNYDQGQQRMRLEDEDRDDAFGEARFENGRNGSSDANLYGLTGQHGPFYGLNGNGDGLPDGSAYTPHLLPAFHHNAPYHNMNNPDHLEDASVLLSMAYPTNFPEAGPGEEAHRDWPAGQTINMMLDQAAGKPKERDAASNGMSAAPSSATTVSETLNGLTSAPSLEASAQTLAGATTNTLGGPNGEQNFLQAMNWLGSANPSEGADSVAPWLHPQTQTSAGSPFSLSAMFSPNTMGMLGMVQTPRTDGAEDPDTESNQLMNVLTQFVNGTDKSNPNPERPLLRISRNRVANMMGEYTAVSKHSRFYLPGDRFVGCYEIPHWALPPLRTLSVMASRTFHTVLSHFSFVHAPTFRLIDTAACLAFAICTVSGIRPTHTSVKFYEMLSKRPQAQIGDASGLDGPVPPGRSWEKMSSDSFGVYGEIEDEDNIRPTQDDEKKMNQWETATVVRNEKTNMLVKSFSLAKGVLMTEYNVSLLQSLILFYAPSFLSEEESERQMANMFMGTIVTIARQIGVYASDLEHFEQTIPLPSEPYTPNELNLYWRRWIQLETRRRTAFLIFHLDTVAAIESSQPCILLPTEVANLLLPAPDTMWKAADAEAWLAAAKKYRPMNLDEAMRRTFFLPSFGPFDALHEKADTKYYNLLNESVLGPFARVSMVLALLRGVMDIGEGKRDRGDWRDLTDLWVSCSWLKPGKKCLDAKGEDMGAVSRDGLRERFGEALRKWREGWDFDPLCPSPAISGPMAQGANGHSSVSQASASLSGGSDTTPSTGGSPQEEAEGSILNYCEEALPYYWLASALLSLLQVAPPDAPGWTTAGQGGGVNYSEMLKTARTFTRLGEGLGASAVTAQTHTAPASVPQASPLGAGAGGATTDASLNGLLDPSLLTPGGGLDLSSFGPEWLQGAGLMGNGVGPNGAPGAQAWVSGDLESVL